MTLLEALPPSLRKFVTSCKCGFDPASLTVLFLQNGCDEAKALKAAIETEVRWEMAIERYAARKAAETRKEVSNHFRLKAERAARAKAELLS